MKTIITLTAEQINMLQMALTAAKHNKECSEEYRAKFYALSDEIERQINTTANK